MLSITVRARTHTETHTKRNILTHLSGPVANGRPQLSLSPTNHRVWIRGEKAGAAYHVGNKAMMPEKGARENSQGETDGLSTRIHASGRHTTAI